MTQNDSIRIMSVSKLQLCLAKTLNQLSANNQALTVTRFRKPSHVVIPVACLTPEIQALLPAGLLTQTPLSLAEEISA